MENIQSIIIQVIEKSVLKKIVFSKANDKNIIKTVGTLFLKDNIVYIQFEIFHVDGKATHLNLIADDSVSEIENMIANQYNQTNIITLNGECEIKKSNSGKIFVSNKIKLSTDNVIGNIKTHNNQKNYIIKENEKYDFLFYLDICDEDGHIFDKKRGKFRQINRFLEIISDIYDKLESTGELFIYDLCCGKSYLTFAVYYYFTEILKRKVNVCGVDLKKDVIDYCNDVAKKLNFDNLKFICNDINEFVPETRSDLVISLHACDTATDIILANAVKWNTGVILSSPCCHHEMFNQIKNDSLSFILDHSMLKQKLCDAATDALRAKLLEVEGYSVKIFELVDPDNTPKNLMIHAVKLPSEKISLINTAKLRDEYNKACDFLGYKGIQNLSDTMVVPH